MDSITKTGFALGLSAVLALSLVGCAMPGEEDGTEASEEQTEQTEQTDTQSSELMIGGGGFGGGGSCDGTSCKSDDGNQSCSCATGERCVKSITRCWCEKATFATCGGFGGGGVIMR